MCNRCFDPKKPQNSNNKKPNKEDREQREGCGKLAVLYRVVRVRLIEKGASQVACLVEELVSPREEHEKSFKAGAYPQV